MLGGEFTDFSNYMRKVSSNSNQAISPGSRNLIKKKKNSLTINEEFKIKDALKVS